MCVTRATLILILVAAALLSGQIAKGELSKKARKLFAETSTTSTPDFGEDDDDDWFGEGDADGDWLGEEEEDDEEDFGFDFDFDELSAFGEKDLPLCSDLTTLEVEFGVECDNETAAVPEEIRIHDVLMERLVKQMWDDFQAKMRLDARINGLVIDPLDVDSLLEKPIAIEKAGGYDASVNMTGIKVYGLSEIFLNLSDVTRNENLTDINVDVRFGFDDITINGSYSMEGNLGGWWDLDTKGYQSFLIAMKNATFSVNVEMDIVGLDEGNTTRYVLYMF